MRRAALSLALTLAGCTLETGAGGDDDGTARGPIGRTFLLERTIATASDCGEFAELEQTREVEVEASEVFVDGTLAAGPVIRPGPVREDAGDPPNLAFTVFESWSSSTGGANPLVQYTVWVDGAVVTGVADTSFPPDCTYAWTVVGR